MTASLVLTVLGNDRPGLVEALSEAVVEHGGEWIDSRMASLSGKFAGILHVNVPEERVEALTAALRADRLHNLSVLVEKAALDGPRRDYRGLTLDLLGQDRPGIVHQISQALTRLDINVDELETGVFEAAMSGEHMFRAKARLSAPRDTPVGELRQVLESLADELMVDIELADEPE